MPSRVRKICTVSLCVLGAALLGGLIFCRLAPVGHFDSTTLLGLHDRDDVLTFSNGVVTQETCCGDTSYGGFERRPDQAWVWCFEQGKTKPVRFELVLKPGLFGLTCYESNNPAKVYWLRRRLSAPRVIDF